MSDSGQAVRGHARQGDCARGERDRGHHVEPHGRAEELEAIVEHGGMDDQPGLVDETEPGERLREARAAVGEDRPARLRLSRAIASARSPPAARAGPHAGSESAREKTTLG